MTTLLKDIRDTINRHSAENESNTPDFILARYLLRCLAAFDEAVNNREVWHDRCPADIEETVPESATDPHTDAPSEQARA